MEQPLRSFSWDTPRHNGVLSAGVATFRPLQLPNRYAIFSTRSGRYGPRLPIDDGRFYSVEARGSEQEALAFAFAAQLRHDFPDDCAKVVGDPRILIFEYFDHVDVKELGVHMLESTLHKLDWENSTYETKLVQFMFKWIAANPERYKIFMSTDSIPWSRQEIVVYGLGFLEDALKFSLGKKALWLRLQGTDYDYTYNTSTALAVLAQIEPAICRTDTPDLPTEQAMTDELSSRRTDLPSLPIEDAAVRVPVHRRTSSCPPKPVISVEEEITGTDLADASRFAVRLGKSAPLPARELYRASPAEVDVLESPEAHQGEQQPSEQVEVVDEHSFEVSTARSATLLMTSSADFQIVPSAVVAGSQPIPQSSKSSLELVTPTSANEIEVNEQQSHTTRQRSFEIVARSFLALSKQADDESGENSGIAAHNPDDLQVFHCPPSLRGRNSISGQSDASSAKSQNPHESLTMMLNKDPSIVAASIGGEHRISPDHSPKPAAKSKTSAESLRSLVDRDPGIIAAGLDGQSRLSPELTGTLGEDLNTEVLTGDVQKTDASVGTGTPLLQENQPQPLHTSEAVHLCQFSPTICHFSPTKAPATAQRLWQQSIPTVARNRPFNVGHTQLPRAASQPLQHPRPGVVAPYHGVAHQQVVQSSMVPHQIPLPMSHQMPPQRPQGLVFAPVSYPSIQPNQAQPNPPYNYDGMAVNHYSGNAFSPLNQGSPPTFSRAGHPSKPLTDDARMFSAVVGHQAGRPFPAHMASHQRPLGSQRDFSGNSAYWSASSRQASSQGFGQQMDFAQVNPQYGAYVGYSTGTAKQSGFVAASNVGAPPDFDPAEQHGVFAPSAAVPVAQTGPEAPNLPAHTASEASTTRSSMSQKPLRVPKRYRQRRSPEQGSSMQQPSTSDSQPISSNAAVSQPTKTRKRHVSIQEDHEVDYKKLHIKSTTLNEQIVSVLCNPFGALNIGPVIRKEKQGKLAKETPYCFVDFADSQSAGKAREALNGRILEKDGRPIRVNFAWVNGVRAYQKLVNQQMAVEYTERAYIPSQMVLPTSTVQNNVKQSLSTQTAKNDSPAPMTPVKENKCISSVSDTAVRTMHEKIDGACVERKDRVVPAQIDDMEKISVRADTIDAGSSGESHGPLLNTDQVTEDITPVSQHREKVAEDDIKPVSSKETVQDTNDQLDTASAPLSKPLSLNIDLQIIVSKKPEDHPTLDSEDKSVYQSQPSSAEVWSTPMASPIRPQINKAITPAIPDPKLLFSKKGDEIRRSLVVSAPKVAASYGVTTKVDDTVMQANLHIKSSGTQVVRDPVTSTMAIITTSKERTQKAEIKGAAEDNISGRTSPAETTSATKADESKAKEIEDTAKINKATTTSERALTEIADESQTQGDIQSEVKSNESAPRGMTEPIITHERKNKAKDSKIFNTMKSNSRAEASASASMPKTHKPEGSISTVAYYSASQEIVESSPEEGEASSQSEQDESAVQSTSDAGNSADEPGSEEPVGLRESKSNLELSSQGADISVKTEKLGDDEVQLPKQPQQAKEQVGSSISDASPEARPKPTEDLVCKTTTIHRGPNKFREQEATMPKQHKWTKEAIEQWCKDQGTIPKQRKWTKEEIEDWFVDVPMQPMIPTSMDLAQEILLRRYASSAKKGTPKKAEARAQNKSKWTEEMIAKHFPDFVALEKKESGNSRDVPIQAPDAKSESSEDYCRRLEAYSPTDSFSDEEAKFYKMVTGRSSQDASKQVPDTKSESSEDCGRQLMAYSTTGSFSEEEAEFYKRFASKSTPSASTSVPNTMSESTHQGIVTVPVSLDVTGKVKAKDTASETKGKAVEALKTEDLIHEDEHASVPNLPVEAGAEDFIKDKDFDAHSRNSSVTLQADDDILSSTPVSNAENEQSAIHGEIATESGYYAPTASTEENQLVDYQVPLSSTQGALEIGNVVGSVQSTEPVSDSEHERSAVLEGNANESEDHIPAASVEEKQLIDTQPQITSFQQDVETSKMMDSPLSAVPVSSSDQERSATFKEDANESGSRAPIASGEEKQVADIKGSISSAQTFSKAGDVMDSPLSAVPISSSGQEQSATSKEDANEGENYAPTASAEKKQVADMEKPISSAQTVGEASNVTALPQPTLSKSKKKRNKKNKKKLEEVFPSGEALPDPPSYEVHRPLSSSSLLTQPVTQISPVPAPARSSSVRAILGNLLGADREVSAEPPAAPRPSHALPPRPAVDLPPPYEENMSEQEKRQEARVESLRSEMIFKKWQEEGNSFKDPSEIMAMPRPYRSKPKPDPELPVSESDEASMPGMARPWSKKPEPGSGLARSGPKEDSGFAIPAVPPVDPASMPLPEQIEWYYKQKESLYVPQRNAAMEAETGPGTVSGWTSTKPPRMENKGEKPENANAAKGGSSSSSTDDEAGPSTPLQGLGIGIEGVSRKREKSASIKSPQKSSSQASPKTSTKRSHEASTEAPPEASTKASPKTSPKTSTKVLPGTTPEFSRHLSPKSSSTTPSATVIPTPENTPQSTTHSPTQIPLPHSRSSSPQTSAAADLGLSTSELSNWNPAVSISVKPKGSSQKSRHRRSSGSPDSTGSTGNASSDNENGNKGEKQQQRERKESGASASSSESARVKKGMSFSDIVKGGNGGGGVGNGSGSNGAGSSGGGSSSGAGGGVPVQMRGGASSLRSRGGKMVGNAWALPRGQNIWGAGQQ